MIDELRSYFERGFKVWIDCYDASFTQGAKIVIKSSQRYSDKTYILPTSEQANSSRVNDLGSVARGALH